jgi:hypothetical protein
MPDLCTELLRGTLSIAAIAAGSFVALRMYFRQKEYELVKQRYLEQSVDAIAAHVEECLGIVSHNYARTLQLVKSFRDAEIEFDLSELARGFLELHSSQFNQIAHHRLETLIGSKIVWHVYQTTLAACSAANAQIVREFPQAMRVKQTTDRIAASHEEMVATMVRDIRAVHDGTFRYAKLLAELHFLSRLLEVERLGFEAISEFHHRTDVRNMVARLKSAFSDDPDIGPADDVAKPLSPSQRNR